MIPFELRTILVFLVSFFGAVFIIPKLANIALRIGLVDLPDARKDHTGPRPLVGGIGIIISATFCSLVFVPIQGLRGYFLGLSLLLLTGFLDDFRELGPYQKFSSQIFACLLLIYFSNVTLVTFGGLLGGGDLRLPDFFLIVWIVTTFCIVGVVNAINMIDGLDGLAGGISFIAFLAFAIHASIVGQHSLMLLNLALAGSVLGFLRYNWFPANLFMGDAGSLCLGFSLAYMAITLTQSEGSHIRPMVPLLLLAVPIVDTLAVMLKRLVRGDGMFTADRHHLHHIFIRYGFSRQQTVHYILALSLLLTFLSFLSPVFHVKDSVLFLIFIGYCIIYVGITYYMRISGRQEPVAPEKLRKGRHKKFLSLLDFMRFVRKSNRYLVELECCCTVLNEQKAQFSGIIRNISNDGFLLVSENHYQLSDNVMARITFPFEHYTHLIELPCRQVWSLAGDGEYQHGFAFLLFDGMQEQLMFKFLVKQKVKIR